MMFGPWGNDDRADAIRVIHRALDAGINFVDTADVYSGGVSEEIVGEALQGRRDDVVLATKFFMPMDDRPNHGGGSRRWIIQEVEASLRRLKTNYIDLYQSPPEPDDRRRGDPRRADRPRAPGQGPLHRLVLLLGQPYRRGAMGVPRASTQLPSGASIRGSCSTTATRRRTGSWTEPPVRTVQLAASAARLRGIRAGGAPGAPGWLLAVGPASRSHRVVTSDCRSASLP